jgi:hypothetical protein
MVMNVPAEIPKVSLRARFLAWAIETALGFTVFVMIFGNVAAPLFLGVSTATWDPYSILLWGFMMMVCIAAFMIRVVESAKNNFSSLI